MKLFARVLAVCLALVGLAGCGGSRDDGGNDGSSPFQSSLQGTWSTCLVTGASTSAKLTVVITGRGFTETGFNYSNTSCTEPGSQVLIGWGTLTIGSAVNANLGDTSVIAYEVNVTQTINGGTAETVFDLEYIDTNVSPNRFYIGDTSGGSDGSSAAARPATLDATFYFSKQ